MSETTSREELLAWRPARIASSGWRNPEGNLRTEVTGTWALAAATQFDDAGVVPRELATSVEAVRQALPLHSGPAHERFAAAVDEALEIVEMMKEEPAHPAIQAWLAGCAAAVRTEQDIADAEEYFLTVLRQYAAVAAIKRNA